MMESFQKLSPAMLALVTTGTLLSGVLASTTAYANTTTTSADIICVNDTSDGTNACPDKYFRVNDLCGVSTASTLEPGTINTTSGASERLVACRLCHSSCTACNSSSPCTDHDSQGLSITAKIGIGVGAGVGGLVIIIIIVVLSVCLCRRRSPPAETCLSQPPGIEQLTESRAASLERDSKPGQKAPPERGKTRPGRKAVVEEATYVNVQSQSIRTSSIEHGHDKMFRYVKDPTLKKAKADPESEEVKNLPEAPPPPVVPDQQDYEIREITPNDRVFQNTVGKPQIKPKPAAKPNQGRRHKTTTLKQGDATGLVDSKSKSTSLPMFPIEEDEINREEEMKKKEEEEKKRKKEEEKKHKKVEERKKKAVTAAGLKGRPQPSQTPTPAAPQAPPSEDEEDEEGLPDYENEGTVTLMRQKAKEKPAAETGGGVDNPAVSDQPQEEYGNQAAVQGAAWQRGDNGSPGDVYMPMDGTGGALGGLGDEPSEVYENENSPRVGHDQPHHNGQQHVDTNVYQNFSFPKNTSR